MLSLNITHTMQTTNFVNAITCIKQSHTLVVTKKIKKSINYPLPCCLLHFSYRNPFSSIKFSLQPRFHSTTFHPIGVWLLRTTYHLLWTFNGFGFCWHKIWLKLGQLMHNFLDQFKGTLHICNHLIHTFCFGGNCQNGKKGQTFY